MLSFKGEKKISFPIADFIDFQNQTWLSSCSVTHRQHISPPQASTPDHFNLLISSLMTDRSLTSPPSILQSFLPLSLPSFLPLLPQYTLICVRNWARLGCYESSVKLALWRGTLRTFNTVLNPSSQSTWQNMKQSHAIISFGLSPKLQCWKQ